MSSITLMNINSTPIELPSNLLAVDFDPFAEGELLLTAPATPAQTEIWLSVQMGDAANCAYNLSQSFRLTGLLNQAALASSLQQLVNRHESLRTSFSSNGESLCIVAELPIDLPLIDLTDLSPPERELQLAQIVKHDLNQPFKIEQGPLFRAQMIKLAAQEHLLLLNAHHIVCDGWSWSILIEDLGALYSAQVQGIAPNLPVAEKFSDYATAEIAAAQQPDAAATEQYWLAQFAGAVPVVDFPTDRPRPSFRTFNAARADYELAGEIGEQLKELGKKFGCSFNTTILAGFEVLLHRLTGQDDLIVGIPACGQIAAGQDRLVGHCTNLLPLRTQIDGNKSFVDYLQQRRSTILDAYEHQQFTFGSLVSKLALPRDPSRIPLAPIMFNLDRAAASNRQLFSGLELTSQLNPREFETFELFINAVELADKIVLECQYNTNLFDRATIQRHLSEFETLLQGIIANPAQLISRLPILTTAARQQILVDWNQTQADYPDTKCLHHLVETQVKLTPDAVAIVFEEQQLTYAELDCQANQVANYLIDVGVKPATFVGICVERSLQMVVGLLGILKTGAAYVPIDPNYPVDRIEYMLADAQIEVLLTQQPLIPHLPTQVNQLVCLDTDGARIAQAETTAPVVQITPESIAYVIYTSGSTGKPKGVEVLHRGVVNFLTSMQHQPGIVATDILLSVTTLSFDIAVLEIFLPITVGASVLLLSREDAMDGRKLATTIDMAGVTIMQATPSTWRLLLEAEWAGSKQLKILAGGEAISRELAAQLLAKSAAVWNMYGPTETTIWSTVEQIITADQPISIGRPIANTEIYILDTQLQPVPIGITGDLYIGGVGLARGYWQRPDLTGDKFISHPFSTAPNARIYQTGDLARYLPNGKIECLGRADFQVKLRGFRIELGEIEALLGQHPTIAQAIAMIREDLPGDHRLVAYVVPTAQANTTLSSSELRQFLQQKLPDYFIPAVIVTINALPLTPNGKIDRKALPAPDFSNFQLQTSFIAPQTPTEISLAAIWSQVLRIEQVGIGDDFFELGGHSILAIQVISRARQAFAIDLPLQSLFEQPTIAGLASRIDTSLWFKISSQKGTTATVDEMEEIEI
jgi:amino acid adenylation domain-containing protein